MKPSGNAQAATFDFLQPPRAADEIGRLGPYRILRVVGSGAMGVVFLAEDTRGWRQVALKALKPSVAGNEKMRQRFLRECQATKDLKHKHVIAIHDVGQVGDVPYLAMEFLQGESLDASIKRDGALPVAEVLRIGRETAEGLTAAHGHGLVHRDVKPSNLWLEGDARRVKVLDFGLARQTGPEQTNLTQFGVIVGTPSYMAPEQAKGEAIDARADLFSLGCVLYRMSTGEVAFRGKDPMSILMALTLDTPVPPLEHRPDLPPELQHLILRLLSKQADRRPPSAEAVVQAIRTIEQRLANKPAPRPSRKVMPVAVELPPADTTELAVDATTLAARKAPRRKLWPPAIVGGAAVFVMLLFFGLFALTRPTEGTVSLDAEDADVEIALLDQGREVALLDRKSHQEARLPPGTYDVDVRKGRDGLGLSAERVTVTRGGREVLHVTRDVLGNSLNPTALVAFPPRIPDLEGWTLDTRDHRGRVRAAALSADGKWLATGGDDATVRVWAYPNGELARVLVAHTAPVTALKWSADGKALATFGDDKKGYLWDFYDPKYAKANRTDVAAPAMPAEIAAPDGKTLTLDAGRVLLRDADKAKEPKVLVQPRPPSSPVLALAAAPDGKTIASIHADSSIRVWEANSGKLLAALKAADNPKALLAWAPDGKTLATSHGPTIRLWDVDSGTEAKNFAAGPVLAMAWSPDGKTLALSAGPELLFWEAATGQSRKTKVDAAGSLAWSNDGKALVVGGGKVVEVWDVNPDKLRLKCERPANAGPVATVAWSPDGKAVAEAGNTGTRLYDPKTGKLVTTIAIGPPAAVPLMPSWSPDGRTLLCGAVNKPELRDAATSRSLRLLAAQLGGLYAWSPDSRTLAFASAGDVRLFSAETGRPRGVVVSPGTDKAVFVLATGHFRAAPGVENELVYVTQSERGQQTLTPAEFAKAWGWKNDPRWVRFSDR